MAPSHIIRASLCLAACSSQETAESSTLLQAVRAKSVLANAAEVSTASGTTASELRLVESMATSLVKNGEKVSPEVKKELETLITDYLVKTKEQIKANHDSDIAAGNDFVNNYKNGCLATFQTSQSDFVSHLAPDGVTGQDHAAHKACREQWRKDDSDRSTKCQALEGFLAQMRTQATTALKVPSTRKGMADWWPKIKNFADNEAQWKLLNDACIAAEGVEDDRLANCNTKQGVFENNVCTQRQEVLTGCEDYDNCYALAKSDLAAQRTDGLAGATSRKLEWEAISKIECFVNILLKEDGEATAGDLDTCKGLVTDTSFLDLIAGGFPVLPDKKECVTSALDAYGGHPCQQSFLDTSYEGLSDTNLAVCNGCSDLPDTHTIHDDVGTWVKVYQIDGEGMFSYNTGAVGNLNENGVTNHAKLSDDDINALAKPLDGWSHVYMIHSPKTGAIKAYMRTNNPYVDTIPSLGAGHSNGCQEKRSTGYSAGTFRTCTRGMDGLGSGTAGQGCDRYFSGYGSSTSDCWPNNHGQRCWRGGASCSGVTRGDHVILPDVSVYVYAGGD